MTRTVSTAAKLEFVFAMARHSGATLADCQQLLRYSASYAKAYREREEERQPFIRLELHKKCERMGKRIKAICNENKINAELGGDPRGCVVNLRLPDGYGNDFGGEGLLCVPTS